MKMYGNIPIAFVVYALLWKITFHIIAFYCAMKVNTSLGVIMLLGYILHQLVSLYVMKGKKIKSEIVDKE